MGNFEKLYQDFLQLAATGESSTGISPENAEKMKPFIKNITDKRAYLENFTPLQRQAFSTPDFWGGKNIIVQGATSAGKTLTAEFSMAYQLYCLGKKVIYLVPLKTLTTEKLGDFQQDFRGMKIYCSSSDYQEHDYDLMRGNYDIGILVYEKFFALLAQNSATFLKNCDLVVVDELHMLADLERGPKLEFSIEKLRYSYGGRISVLGLTTTESKVDNVKRWLGDNKTEIIRNEERPVDIEERFIAWDKENDELYLSCYNNGEQIERPEKIPFSADVGNGDAHMTMLLNIIQNHPNEKIIIFCKGKRRGAQLAKDICDSGVLKKQELRYDNMPEADECEMEESLYGDFRKKLQDYGVVCHNSNLTFLVRNFIESNFDKGDIRIIIATETLTMGVNLPTDVMIMYDISVWRADGEDEMTYHDYKNAIGRAGRLGKNEKGKGISYVLFDNPKKMAAKEHEFIIERRAKLIGSALNEDMKFTGIKDKKMLKNMSYGMAVAPYYLNLLNDRKGRFSDEDLLDIINNGFTHNSDNEATAEGVISALRGYGGKEKKWLPELLMTNSGNFNFSMGSEENEYSVNGIGKAFSGYALSEYTLNYICNCFLQLSQSGQVRGLPIYSKDNTYTILNPTVDNSPEKESDTEADDSTKDTPPDYFFDVMYNICCMPEVAKNGAYVSPNIDNTEVSGNINSAVIRFIKSRNTEKDFLPDSYWLKCLNTSNYEIDNASLLAMYRTIVLYYWITGRTVIEMRRKLGLPDTGNYYVYTPEVQSLGDICAHLLEAVSMGFKARSDIEYPYKKHMADCFYALSIRIKYGMSLDLARIANKHINSLSRTKLLRLERKAKELNFNSVTELIFQCPKETLKLITDEQRSKLMGILIEPLTFEYDKLMDSLQKDSKIETGFADSWEEFLSYSSSASLYLLDVLSKMGLRVSRDKEAVLFSDERTALHICRSEKDYSCSSEILSDMNIPESDDLLHIVIYKKGNLSDAETNRSCISLKQFKLAVLKCISVGANMDTAGKNLVRLLKKFAEAGEAVFRADKLNIILNGIEEIAEMQPPAVMGETAVAKIGETSVAEVSSNDISELTQAIYNLTESIDNNKNITNVIANVTNTQVYSPSYTQNNVQLSNTNNDIQVNNTLNDIDVSNTRNDINVSNTQINNTQYNISVINEYLNMINEDRINADEYSEDDLEQKEAEFFNAEEEKIVSRLKHLLPENYEEICEQIINDIPDISCEKLFDDNPEAEAVKESIFQAVYLEQIMTAFDRFDDFAPAGILYGKMLEHYLKKQLLPKFRVYSDVRTKATDPDNNKYYMDNIPEELVTLGNFTTTIRVKLKYDKRFDWMKIHDLINDASTIRNTKCAHAGHKLDMADLKTLRDNTFYVIANTKKLPPIR